MYHRTGVWQVQEADGSSDGKRLQRGGLREEEKYANVKMQAKLL